MIWDQAATLARTQLYWDAGNHVIAIHFESKDVKSAFPALVASNGRVAIPATRFFETNGLDLTQLAAQYRFQVESARTIGIAGAADDAKVFIVALDEEHRF